MKLQIARVLNHHVIADDTFIKFAQAMCFLGSISILFLSIWKLSRLDLSDAQLFFGVLLSVITPMLLVVIGLLLPMARTVKNV